MANDLPEGPGYERVVDLNARRALKGGGGGGTFDPMEARVAALEKRFDKFDAKLDRLIETVAELKGRVSASPTTWQLLGIVITTWAAGAAIVFALTRLAR